MNAARQNKTVQPRLHAAFAILTLACLFPGASSAQELAVNQGRRLTEANCASCHAIGRFGDSPLPIAPPLRSLHLKYPVEDLEESLAEGISTGHPTMPQFRFESDQVRDFIAYLKSLETPPKPGN
jgi:cytochrome c